MSWDTKLWDLHGTMANLTTDSFVIKRNGYYSIGINIHWGSITNKQIFMNIGSTFSNHRLIKSIRAMTDNPQAENTWMKYLTVGDIVNFWVFQSNKDLESVYIGSSDGIADGTRRNKCYCTLLHE